ncbi:MAG: hypothetical protein WA126_07285 [Thermodesulfovibrionales bacterium]
MRKIALISVVLFVFILTKYALSWDDSATHKDLSRYAADSSFLRNCINETDKNCDYLKNLGFNKGLIEVLKWDGNKTIKEDSIKNWLAEGAKLEDAGNIFNILFKARFDNHFHNPLNPWLEAGLTDIKTGESSLLWAQDGVYQETFTEGDWSWRKIRDYYHLALISTIDSIRQENFAKVFKGLGHQMHLIQDGAVPEHTRNDAHPLGRNKTGGLNIEAWAAEEIRNIAALKAFAPEAEIKFPAMPDPSALTLDSSYYNKNLAPSALFLDTDQYNSNNPSQFFADNFATSLTIGITEYTNANFVSDHTVFTENLSQTDKHYFPYPRKLSTNLQQLIAKNTLPETVIAEDGVAEPTLYIKKERDGESIGHFVKPRYTTTSRRDIIGGGTVYELDFYRDEKCHEDYAQKLIPRAVGYSAGLLDYFFRGSMAISLPDSGVYAQTDNPAAGFTQITLLAKNITPNNEQMNDGTIELVVGYRRALDDPFLNYPEDYPFQAENEITRIVIPEKNGIRSIPADGSVELTFDLSGKPIPLWAINVFIRLIYHGRLGNEDGAVVVGFKDISEPTPVDLFNDMDRVCLNGSLYSAGSPEAIDQVDTNNNGIPTWDVYPHDLSDIYFRTSPANNPQYASDTNYNIAVPYLNAGYYTRASYILTDYTFSYNSYQSLIKKDTDDTWGHTAWTSGINPGIAIKNQIEYEEDAAVCAPLSAPCNIWWYPTFLEYRGVNIWWGGGIMYINNAYPQNSECSCYQGVLRNCMSGTQTIKAVDNVSKSGVLQKDSADDTTERNNAQMMPLTQKQRRIPSDR